MKRYAIVYIILMLTVLISGAPALGFDKTCLRFISTENGTIISVDLIATVYPQYSAPIRKLDADASYMIYIRLKSDGADILYGSYDSYKTRDMKLKLIAEELNTCN